MYIKLFSQMILLFQRGVITNIIISKGKLMKKQNVTCLDKSQSITSWLGGTFFGFYPMQAS